MISSHAANISVAVPRHYLLVDDNVDYVENAAEILADQGYRVAVALNGEQALELVRRHRFNALVTDLRMPGMDGLQLLQAVREQDPGLPVLVVTAFAAGDVLARVEASGVFALLPKPTPPDMLLNLLSRVRRDGLVALVEDDASLLDNLRESLHGQGYSVVTAETVQAAAALCATQPVCAVVDLRVPGGPPGAALAQLRDHCPWLPVVAMTGYESEAAPPSVRLLRKPFATPELLRAIEEQRALAGAA